MALHREHLRVSRESRLISTRFGQQCGSSTEIGCVVPFGKPAVDGPEQIVSRSRPSFPEPEVGEVARQAKLPEFCFLLFCFL